MVARWAGRSTRNWREVRRAVLAASDICHWCGHPGSRAVDHHPIPLRDLLRIAPELAEHPESLRPIHGVEGCPYCPPVKGKPRRCNGEKGSKRHAAPPVAASRPW